jgi:perosamine synthetase
MIPLFKVMIDESVVDEIKKVMLSGYIGQGKKVEEFEERLKSDIFHTKPLTVNSCTSAIHLALRLAGVGVGDEVISTPMTCTATNMPILERGADIVWADIDFWTGGIDVVDVEKKITPKTKAIVCVHWAGYPCNLPALHNLEIKYNIPVIQDAAHALGATCYGKDISRWTKFSCFSFQAIKHLTCGDGGALICLDEADYIRGKLLRWYGIDRESNRKDFRCEEDIKEFGYKFNMNDLNATIGLCQLQHFPHILKAHRENAKKYNEAFYDMKKVKLLSAENGYESSYWIYTMLVDNVSAFMEFMKKKDIMVSQVHARNDKHTAFKKFKTPLPGVDTFCKYHISIPVGSWLTPDETAYIIKAVKEYDNV